MCRAGFVDDIKLITVFATFGLFLIKNLLKIPEIHVVCRCFLTNQMCRRVLIFLCTNSSSTYFRHIIKVYTSERHDTDSENHTVVIRKMRSAGLYSTARYGMNFEQYIHRYILKWNT